MRASRRRKLEVQTQPHLAVGERIELFGMAKVGKAPAAKNVAAAAIAIAVGTVLGGAAVVMFSQKSVYLVLTDRQLLFFGMNTSTGGPAGFITKVPRAAVAAEVLSDGLMLKVRLDIAGPYGQPPTSLLLTVAPLPPSNKAAGGRLASALLAGGARRTAQSAVRPQ